MAWFDATIVDPSQGSAAWPLGQHPVVITKGELRPVKDKPQSGMLAFSLQVIDGPHKGFVGEYRLNLFNENPQASEIAGRQLSSLCHVIGVYVLNDRTAAELYNKPFIIQVTPQKNDDKYTEISAVFDMAGQPPAKGQAPSAGHAPQAGPGAAQAGPGYVAPATAQAAGQPSWAGGGAAAQPDPAPAAAIPSWQQKPADTTAKPSWMR